MPRARKEPVVGLWRFKGTDGIAVLRWLLIGPTSDFVLFRYNGEHKLRRVRVRSFLEHFERLVPGVITRRSA